MIIQHFFSKTSKTGLKICKLEMLVNKSVTAYEEGAGNSEDVKFLVNCKQMSHGL